MTNIISKSIYRAIVARVLAWGALGVCLMTSPLAAQNTVGGNFTLNENTRFGEAVLGAGQYKFSIEPLGTMQSIRSIQPGARHLVLVVLKPEKSGRVTSVFAMASGSGRAREANELILEPEKEGALARTIYLEEEGLTLMVDFRWCSAMAQGKVIAQQIVTQQSAAEPRTVGTN